MKHRAFVHLCFDDFVDIGLSAVRKKYRSRIRIDAKDVVSSVIFLDLAGLFMFTDSIILVIINMTTGYESNLMVFTQALSIEVERWFRILH